VEKGEVIILDTYETNKLPLPPMTYQVANWLSVREDIAYDIIYKEISEEW